MISAIKLKRCVVGACIFGNVVDKLRHGKKPGLMILFEVNKDSEVSFHHTILPFGLPVYLKIESYREFLLYA